MNRHLSHMYTITTFTVQHKIGERGGGEREKPYVGVKER